MHAVDLSLNESRKRKVVKSIGEIVPDRVVAVLLPDLVVEAVDC